MVDTLIRDLRDAVRSVATRPAFAVVTIGTVMMVIGAASAVMAVVNATMIRPLPYPEASRLVRVYMQPPGTTDIRQRNPLNVRMITRLREGYAQQFDSVEGLMVRERALGGDGDPESVAGALATPGTLALLGGPALGRTWTDAEDRANARVVVISHALWQRRFGGAADVIGRRLIVDREPHEVIGVMPVDFHALYLRSELWTPLNLTAQPIETPSTFIVAVARLRAGASVATATDEMQGVMRRVVAEAPAQLTGWNAGVMGIRDAQFAVQRPALIMLLCAAVALTLIACANLANVTLAHVLSRRNEIALRAALGASRAAVVRLQFIESLMLCSVGALGGLLLGSVTLPALLALDPQTARLLGNVDIDWRVQAAIGSVTLLVACISGVWPVTRELRRSVSEGLAAGNRRTIGSARDGRLRRVLVGTEAALAVVLLACGGLLLSAFHRSAGLNPGFDATNVLSAQIRLSPSVYSTPAARNEFITRVLEQLRSLPGVVHAATTTNPFVPGFAFQTLVHIEGQPTADGGAHTVLFRRVSPGYLQTLRIPLRAGRDFTSSDGPDNVAVAMVSRQMAEKHWPGEDPIGRRVIRSGTPLVVVGVVEDVSDVGYGQAPESTVYLPYMQNNPVAAPISLVVRTTGDPLEATARVRAAVLSIDPAQPIDSVLTLEQFLSDSLGAQRFRSTLLIVLAALGCALAALGIYGVTARAVHERTREVGVRLALGASPTSVWRLIAGAALRAVLYGVVGGSVIATAASAAIVATLPGADRAEPWAAIPAVGTLVVAAVCAAAIPARRAGRVSPSVALLTKL